MIDVSREERALLVQGIDLKISSMYGPGTGDPIVFLHGFGSTKEDYADIARLPAFKGRPFIAYDAPGCGESECGDLSVVSVPFLVNTAREVLSRFAVDRFHLVGHSMGGLTALLLAHEEGSRVLSFIDIEGNVAPEDCFLSRQIVSHASDDPHDFLAEFIDRNWRSADFSSSLYLASLAHKVRAEVVRGIFESMVELSDNGDLLAKFVGLTCRKMFMYGEQNAHLSYLSHLERWGVTLACVSHSGHFPMYSNPVEMWERIAVFLSEAPEKHPSSAT